MGGMKDFSLRGLCGYLVLLLVVSKRHEEVSSNQRSLMFWFKYSRGR